MLTRRLTGSVRLDLHPITLRRIAVLPQRRPTCRGHARELGIHADALWANLNPWWALQNTNRPMLVPGDAEVARFLQASAQPVIDLEYALV